jgi:hypothetical protein
VSDFDHGAHQHSKRSTCEDKEAMVQVSIAKSEVPNIEGLTFSRRFATSVLVYGVAFQLWTSLVYLQLEKSTLSDSSSGVPSAVLSETRIIEGNKKALDDEEEDEDVTFIPLSWPRLRPGDLYKKSDPEWQSIQKYTNSAEKTSVLKSKWN